MTSTERDTMPGKWSVFGRHPELDLKTLSLPLSIHLHQDRWEKGKIRPLLTPLLQLPIKSVSISGLSEENVQEALSGNTSFAPYNTKFVYSDTDQALSETTVRLINEATYNNRHNSGQTINFSPNRKEGEVELIISPKKDEELSEDYLVSKIVEFGKK